MSARVHILSPAEEDEIIHNRLFNDERPLRRTVKKIAVLQAPPPPAALTSPAAGEDVDMSGEAPKEQDVEVDSEESLAAKKAATQEDVWEAFNGQLRDVEFLVRKAGVVQRMEEKMRGEYESKGKEIDASQAQLRSEIGTLKTDLDQAQTERQHKMEYDAIALKIKAVGSRSDLETEISTLTARLTTLQAENSSVASTIQARKSRFDNLVEELEAIRKIGTEVEQPVVEGEEQEEEPKAESAEPSRVGSPAAEAAEAEDDEDDEGRREEKKVVAKKKEKELVLEQQAEQEAEGEVSDLLGDVEMQNAEELEAEDMLVASSSKPSSSSAIDPPPSTAADSTALSSPLSQVDPDLAPVTTGTPSKRKASKTPSSGSNSTNPLSISPTQRSSRSSPSIKSPTKPVADLPEVDLLAGMTRSQLAAYKKQAAVDAVASQPGPSSPKRARLSPSPATVTPANRSSRAKGRQASGTPAVEESVGASKGKGKAAAAATGRAAKMAAAKAGGKGKVGGGKKMALKEESEGEQGEGGGSGSDLTEEDE